MHKLSLFTHFILYILSINGQNLVQSVDTGQNPGSDAVPQESWTIPFKLINIEIKNRATTNKIHYEYNPSQRSEIFTPFTPYLIDKVTRNGKIIWDSKTFKYYGARVFIGINDSNQSMFRVYYPGFQDEEENKQEYEPEVEYVLKEKITDQPSRYPHQHVPKQKFQEQRPHPEFERPRVPHQQFPHPRDPRHQFQPSKDPHQRDPLKIPSQHSQQKFEQDTHDPRQLQHPRDTHQFTPHDSHQKFHPKHFPDQRFPPEHFPDQRDPHQRFQDQRTHPEFERPRDPRQFQDRRPHPEFGDPRDPRQFQAQRLRPEFERPRVPYQHDSFPREQQFHPSRDPYFQKTRHQYEEPQYLHEPPRDYQQDRFNQYRRYDDRQERFADDRYTHQRGPPARAPQSQRVIPLNHGEYDDEYIKPMPKRPQQLNYGRSQQFGPHELSDSDEIKLKRGKRSAPQPLYSEDEIQVNQRTRRAGGRPPEVIPLESSDGDSVIVPRSSRRRSEQPVDTHHKRRGETHSDKPEPPTIHYLPESEPEEAGRSKSRAQSIPIHSESQTDDLMTSEKQADQTQKSLIPEHAAETEEFQTVLVNVDINKRKSNEQVKYEYDDTSKTHIFTPRKGYAIYKANHNNTTVWRSKNERYPVQLLVNMDGAEPKLRAVYDELKNPNQLVLDVKDFWNPQYFDESKYITNLDGNTILYFFKDGITCIQVTCDMRPVWNLNDHDLKTPTSVSYNRDTEVVIVSDHDKGLEFNFKDRKWTLVRILQYEADPKKQKETEQKPQNEFETQDKHTLYTVGPDGMPTTVYNEAGQPLYAPDEGLAPESSSRSGRSRDRSKSRSKKSQVFETTIPASTGYTDKPPQAAPADWEQYQAAESMTIPLKRPSQTKQVIPGIAIPIQSDSEEEVKPRSRSRGILAIASDREGYSKTPQPQQRRQKKAQPVQQSEPAFDNIQVRDTEGSFQAAQAAKSVFDDFTVVDSEAETEFSPKQSFQGPGPMGTAPPAGQKPAQTRKVARSKTHVVDSQPPYDPSYQNQQYPISGPNPTKAFYGHTQDLTIPDSGSESPTHDPQQQYPSQAHMQPQYQQMPAYGDINVVE